MDAKDQYKMVADFMEMKYGEERSWTKEGGWVHTIQSLSRYRDDYNWLMEVVEKILRLDEPDSGFYQELIDSLAELRGKEGIYTAVINFLEWYNEQQKSG